MREDEIPGWPGKYHFDCDLGQPTVVISLETLSEREKIREAKKWLRFAVNLYPQNTIHYHLCVPYFNWIVKTRPEGGDFAPGFYHVGIPNVDQARIDAVKSLRHSLISLAMHFKETPSPVVDKPVPSDEAVEGCYSPTGLPTTGCCSLY